VFISRGIFGRSPVREVCQVTDATKLNVNCYQQTKASSSPIADERMVLYEK